MMDSLSWYNTDTGTGIKLQKATSAIKNNSWMIFFSSTYGPS